MELSIGGMIGLYGGMICGIFGWWFGRKKARKNRGLDELYYHIWQKARSTAWYATLGAIYILFSIVMFGVELSNAMVLGILLLTHLGSWAISGIILSINMSSEDPVPLSRKKMGIAIVIISIIVFTTLSIATSNWMFLLLSLPPNLIGLLTALAPDQTDSN